MVLRFIACRLRDLADRMDPPKKTVTRDHSIHFHGDIRVGDIDQLLRKQRDVSMPY
ncbi:hypothetical protein [Nocardia wallacei]|uniref:hypothetical protein n=1 Tax=Nocardia wallacei TaxID=480035 RepID=UPI0024551FB0|nr:hypothetical protein [Nocardia wallacei]